jgi:CheY-like chemotaxis protein
MRRPLKILVVDDTPSNAKQLEVVARKLGHETVFAEDGIIAIERYEQEKPDLIIMDIMMPRMDGITAAERIRAMPTDKWVPIVFFSALDSVQDVIQGLEKGGDDYLTKPANLSLMRAKINGYTRVLEMQDALIQQTRELLEWRNESEEQARLGHHVMSRIVDAEGLNDPLLRWFNIPTTTFSGDLLCAARGPDGVLYLMLADATGHGLAAALSALPLTQVFYGMVAKGFPLPSIAQELNRKLKAIMPSDRFVAAILAAIDIDHRTLEIWNGGLPDALFVTEAGELQKRWLSRHPPLGVMPQDYFSADTETHHFLEAGELVICSDGLVELDTGSGNMLDIAAIEALLTAGPAAECHDRIRQYVDKHLQGEPGHDDISCMVVDVPLEEVKALPITAHVHAPQGPVSEWRLELSWGAQELRDIDVVPAVLNLTNQIRALKPHQGVLFLVLSELYNNALDHGLLGLDSSRKDAEGGFEDFLAQRSARLTSLSSGRIDIALHLHMENVDPVLDITLADSGPGFDFENYLAKKAAAHDSGQEYHGRGIALVRQLSMDLAYSGTGNRVWVRYKL